MEYVYDIVLNFRESYYEFYEWHSKDKIINLKRVPIYKISNQDYLNIKYNNIIIDKSSLPKQNKIFLLTSGLEVMGILINNNGMIIKKSSLLFDEADEILEDRDNLITIDIKYEITKQNKIEFKSRTLKEKSEFINNYLNKLDKEKDEYLLKYIYYEIYNKEEKNIDTVIQKLNELSKENVSIIFDSIKKVNLELKQ